MTTTSEICSILLDLEPVDDIDALDKEMAACFEELKTTIAEKSEIELHNELQEKASQSMTKHAQLAKGLLYGILSDSANANEYFRYLNFIVRDGFAYIVGKLKYLAALPRFCKMNVKTRSQLLWMVDQLTGMNVQGIDSLYTILLRQIRGGDVTQKNLSFCEAMVDLLSKNRQWMNLFPVVIASSFYTFIRVILDHGKYLELRQKETDFCVYLLREKFIECSNIGRDLIRALQDVARIPEFEQIWIDLFYRPEKISPHFRGVWHILSVPTPKIYLQSRLTFDMELKLLHIMESLRWGRHQRNLQWFISRYLSTPDSETLYCDLIRYICGVYHPTNAVLASDIVPRYVIIGGLIRGIKSHAAASNAKLALFYDWLFYDPNIDNIMNIEPAVLLMERSVEKYAFITSILLEFLQFVVEEYYPEKANDIKLHVRSAMQTIMEKGVIRSFNNMLGNPAIPSSVRQGISQILGNVVNQNSLNNPSLDSSEPQATSSGFEDDKDPFQMDIQSSFTGQLGQAFQEDPEEENGAEETAEEDVASSYSGLTEGENNESGFIEGDQNENSNPYDEMSMDFNGMENQQESDVLEGANEDFETEEQYEEGTENEASLDVENEEEEGEGEGEEEEDEEEESVDEASLWLFGDLLKDFREATTNEEIEKSETLLKEILEVFAKTAVPPENLAPSLSRAVRKSTLTDLDQDYFTQDEESKDLISILLDQAWTSSSDPALETRMLTLLNKISGKVEAVGFRWILCIFKHSVHGSKNKFDNVLLDKYTAFATVEDAPLKEQLLKDMTSLQESQINLFYEVLPYIFKKYPEICVGNTDFLHLAVAMMDPSQVYQLMTSLNSDELTMFGQSDYETSVGPTLEWETFEQICVWQLIAAEIAGKTELVEMLFASLFDKLQADANPEALNGLLALLRTVPPTKQIVSTLGNHRDGGSDPFFRSCLTQWSRLWSDSLAQAFGDIFLEIATEIKAGANDESELMDRSKIHLDSLHLWLSSVQLSGSALEEFTERLLKDSPVTAPLKTIVNSFDFQQLYPVFYIDEIDIEANSAEELGSLNEQPSPVITKRETRSSKRRGKQSDGPGPLSKRKRSAIVLSDSE
ncbi:hypothetical protein K493DRAFT_313249 [Basidiobolus meristosporus CBS 931.73]|uniref:SOSS complex subunit A homolog n=1 Tax=Basidiobolus meristosporus CBS 931.73 TaxID=1314790 RepID=A0A1Y1YMY0_9FUNG|nr:hypothetical protein K493DRAFT_313249 [Basidiobolus meristosporus CBS 931.73]|eukprot:ORX99369.1 hypothetical protein K493DRAFT_313249 [Basidiobolus meristosporus CBS 931.73]